MRRVWLLPLAVVVAAVVAGAPCASLNYFFVAASMVFVIAAAVPTVASVLNVTLHNDLGRYVRTFKFVQHVLVAALALPYLTTDWVAAIGTSTAVSEFLHGWQFWSWVLFGFVDPFVHDSSTRFFVMYAVHHAVTLTLIAYASSYSLTYVGAAVMATTETTDVLYSLLKLGVLSQRPSVRFQHCVFVTFALTWLALRIVGFSMLIFKPLLVGDPAPDAPFPAVVCCAVLLCMNLAWGWKIAHAAVLLALGRPVRDVNFAVMKTDQVA